jgi:sigma-B regulation protein RsbQ
LAPTRDVRLRHHIQEYGVPEGRPILFAHGYGCSQETWRSVVPAFVDEYRVIAFDLVGSGSSDLASYEPARYDSLHGYADDLVDIVEQLDLRDVVFVGHSVSSMIGVLAANRAPERFGALVLVGPSPRYIDDGAYRGGFTSADIRQLLDSLDANHLGWSAAMAPVIMGNADRPELGAALTDLFCRTDPRVARQFARVTFLSDNRRDLADVTVPSLVIQSSDDVIAPREVGEYVHRQIPASRFVQLQATGHVPNMSAPDELSGVIRDFLA